MKYIFSSLFILFYISIAEATVNTGDYCLAEDGQNVNQPCPTKLPQNYRAPDGTWYYNINNSDIWSDSMLVAFVKWYPFTTTDTPPAEYPEYYTRSPGDYTVHDTICSGFTSPCVSQDAVYVQWPIEDIRVSKNTELQGELTAYTANELAANVRIQEYVRSELTWFNEQQIALSAEEDWNTVAGWNTSRPASLPLRNSFVGESYVNQGLNLKTENAAAVSAGLPEPWDDTVVDQFISANSAAANDVTDATSPTPPTFEIRQGTVNPYSEGFSRIIVYRKPSGDANPVLDTNYAMILTNREPGDDRPLYIFSYTGTCPGTYLTWRQFIEQPDGTWTLEGTPAEWQYSKGDMCFIFSYGTNFAVTDDYFTNPTAFKTGQNVMTISVAWDKE